MYRNRNAYPGPWSNPSATLEFPRTAPYCPWIPRLIVLGRMRRIAGRARSVVGAGCRASPRATSSFHRSPTAACRHSTDETAASSALAGDGPFHTAAAKRPSPSAPRTQRFIIISSASGVALCSGVKSPMHLAQVPAVEVRVNLRRLNGPVSEELLHDAEVATSLEQMRRAGVPERVGRHHALDAGGGRVLPQELPVAHPRERASQ